MMKFNLRYIIVAILLCLSLIFTTSCIMPRGFIETDRELAYDTLVRVTDAIDSRNADKLKSMFSEKALSEIKDIDKEIQQLFEYYEGETLEFAKDDIELPFSGEEREDDWYIKEIEQSDKIKTDKNEYVIGICSCAENTKNPENEGIEAIGIIKTENGDEPFADVSASFYGIHIAD